jgi:hypothetical protein
VALNPGKHAKQIKKLGLALEAKTLTIPNPQERVKVVMGLVSPKSDGSFGFRQATASPDGSSDSVNGGSFPPE